MSDVEHVIERRALMLSQKMSHRKDTLRDFLAPPGERAPFTKLLNDENALRFWCEHRYDHLGARVLQNMQPNEIAELDLALAQAIEEQDV